MAFNSKCFIAILCFHVLADWCNVCIWALKDFEPISHPSANIVLNDVSSKGIKDEEQLEVSSEAVQFGKRSSKEHGEKKKFRYGEKKQWKHSEKPQPVKPSAVKTSKAGTQAQDYADEAEPQNAQESTTTTTVASTTVTTVATTASNASATTVSGTEPVETTAAESEAATTTATTKKAPTSVKTSPRKAIKAPVPPTTDTEETETTPGLPSAKDMKKDEFYDAEPGKSSDHQFEKLVKRKLQKIEKTLEKISENVMGLKSTLMDLKKMSPKKRRINDDYLLKRRRGPKRNVKDFGNGCDYPSQEVSDGDDTSNLSSKEFNTNKKVKRPSVGFKKIRRPQLKATPKYNDDLLPWPVRKRPTGFSKLDTETPTTDSTDYNGYQSK